MTHNNRVYDLFYFKAIIEDYNIKLEQNLNVRNDRLDKIMNELDKQLETTKIIPFDKKHNLVEKDTFDTMHKVINESKKIMEIQPKINEVFNEINNYVDSYSSLEKENQKYQREIKSLKTRNSNPLQENNKLRNYIDTILEVIKKFFRKLLQIGNESTKEDELFDYADVPNYFKKTIMIKIKMILK